eukprot:gene46358-57806_t
MPLQSFDTESMPTRGPTSVAAADRVLHVLAVLAQHGQPMSAAELMEATGLARSTLYRQLARLKQWGFVLESSGHYAPGPLSLQLAWHNGLHIQAQRPQFTGGLLHTFVQHIGNHHS